MSAQEWERQWWGTCQNTYGEEEKQLVYARKMGLEFFHDGKSPYNIDMHGQSVLDIGGGPCSLLLKCVNVKGTVLDPLLHSLPDWVLARYRGIPITLLPIRGEDLDGYVFDEVWMYNVLQHTENPELVIQNAMKAGRLIRIFEWIDTPANVGHPNSLSEAKLGIWLGGEGKIEILNLPTLKGKCYYGIFSASPLVDEAHTVEKNYKMWQGIPWEGANLMGESWSPSPQWKEALVNEFVKIVEPVKVVLEIGPGAGRFTEFLQKLASHLTLVDLSDKCITLCKERFKDCSNITYFVNDGTDLSFIESSSIDYVFSFDCFNHMSPHDIEKYVAQFPRILKSDGACIIDHGTKGDVGGWRSSLTNNMFCKFLKMHKLVLERQLDSWGNGFRVAMRGDAISIIKKGEE